MANLIYNRISKEKCKCLYLNRDAIIISLMDTFTSFLAGITIFSILGNLAHESGKNVSEVVSAGTGLAFVSYPDAIAKFDIVPQVKTLLQSINLAQLIIFKNYFNNSCLQCSSS